MRSLASFSRTLYRRVESALPSAEIFQSDFFVKLVFFLGAGVVILLASGCGGAGRTIPSASSESASAPPSVAASIVEDRIVVVYANSALPSDVASRVAAAGGTLRREFPALGMVTVDTPSGNSAAVMAAISADSAVASVMHDRILSAHRLVLAPLSMHLSTAPPTTGPTTTGSNTSSTGDSYYTQTPQGWAVAQAGGYGGGIASGSGAPPAGPWNTTMGAGVRIAILDTGVDEAHPDIAPNLALNLSEVEPSSLPSPCDDGSPWDQTGHGTWVASLAAAAAGPSTGLVIGMAPQASILNIKVMQRSSTSSAANAASCEAGQGSGLLSWVIAGIEDAINNHAQVIVMSFGTLVDLDSADGAGWQSTFNAITYKATTSGAVLIASAGNDSFDLSNGRYIELPAQARNVLPIVATTNAACAENLSANSVCAAGPITLPYYSNYLPGALAAPGGSYPEGADAAVSGYVRGACSNGKPGTTDGLPSAGESFGCFNLGHAQYVQAIGTSASAPIAGGVAALLFAAHPGWSPAQVIAQMQRSATPATGQLGYPQVNAAAALP